MLSPEPLIDVSDCGTAMDTRDDLSLLTSIAQQRDNAAFAELYKRYQKPAYNLAFRILRNRALAEDAVQEAMLSIWKSPKSVLPKGYTASWIMRIVANKAINLEWSRRRIAKREEWAAAEQNTQQVAGADVENNELIVQLRSHIDKLPQFECRLLACCYAANMSHREIAELVDIPQRTVTDKIHAALKRLRTSLTKAGVAAVIPTVISNGNLFDAITTGQDCPVGMTERTLRQLSSSGTPIHRDNKTSRRTTAVGKSGFGTFAAVLTVASILVGGLWWAAKRSDSAAGSNAGLTQPASVSGKPLFAHWDFSKGPPDDLQLYQGSWRLENEDPSTGGAAQVTSTVSAASVLPLEIPPGPC